MARKSYLAVVTDGAYLGCGDAGVRANTGEQDDEEECSKILARTRIVLVTINNYVVSCHWVSALACNVVFNVM